MRKFTRFNVGLAAVVVAAAAIAAAAVGGTSRSQAIPAFSASQLNALPGNDWITPAGNLGGMRHSSLSQITPANVGSLTLAFHTKLTAPQVGDPVPEHGGEASHIEYGGTLYSEDLFGRVYANDATTGKMLWYYEPNLKQFYTSTQSGPTTAGGQKGMPITSASAVAATRGVSIGDGLVFVGESPVAAVVAIDATTGKQVWSHVVANINMGSTLSMAPVYYDGMILGATSGGDRGASDIAFALDAKTGKPLWHFNLIPTKKSQPGYDTWTHPLAFNGGGAVWASPSVDSDAGLVYYATGNPIPYNPVVRGPGKEYYTDGILALHVKTGKIAWFYQAVHHDMWDADQSQQPVLYDMEYNGQTRKALAFANKDGLWYILDRLTGKPIVSTPEVKVQQSKEASTFATQPVPATLDPMTPQSVPNPSAWAGLNGPDGVPFNIGSGPGASFVAVDTTRYSVTAAFGSGPNSSRPASIDPTTGLYINESSPSFSAKKAMTTEQVGTLLEGQTFSNQLSASLVGTPAAAVSASRLEAMDLKTGKMVWHIDHFNADQQKGAPSIAFSAGTLTTGSGLIFTASANKLQAYDEKTGNLLWSSPTLAGAITSLPMTYSVNGKQYVTAFINSSGSNAIGAAHGEAGDLYTFVLP
jgi:PQQ-dependent dehydrogenase (methanol/ethanol family)